MKMYLILGILFGGLSMFCLNKARQEFLNQKTLEITKNTTDAKKEIIDSLDSKEKKTKDVLDTIIGQGQTTITETKIIKKNTESTKTSLSEIKTGISDLSETLQENEANPIEIVDFSNKRDSFAFTLTNNTKEPKYVSEVKLYLTNRQPLAYGITALNAEPYINKEVYIKIINNIDTYSRKPKIYLEPKKAEVIPFIIHRPDEYDGYEIMEATYEFIFHDGTVIRSQTIKDFVGQDWMVLIYNEKVIEDYKEELISIAMRNEKIISQAKATELIKSERLKTFLKNYTEEEKKLNEKYKYR